MPRLPLLPAEPEDDDVAAVFEVFGREGRAPIALYRVLAHHPSLLRSYSVLARGLRNDAATPRRLRELVILRTAQLTGSEYEWAHHRAMAEKAGVTREQLAALPRWEGSDAFDEDERAALRMAEEVHSLGVTDESFAALRDRLGPAGSLEVVLTAGFYEAVARVIQALDVELEPEYRPYLADPSREGEADTTSGGG
ncbi:MAG TPA: carboxymuconolactone decarboxylase family protein [Gaiella sp.]|jgi:AhpD family alkylhydroperoxidase